MTTAISGVSTDSLRCLWVTFVLLRVTNEVYEKHCNLGKNRRFCNSYIYIYHRPRPTVFQIFSNEQEVTESASF